MVIETSFAKKVTGFENADDCFLAPLRNDGELDLARGFSHMMSRNFPNFSWRICRAGTVELKKT
jgi:hypothetical protein